jgi:nitrite reductase/ring-hydroxylating ferredoxin subunit
MDDIPAKLQVADEAPVTTLRRKLAHGLVESCRRGAPAMAPKVRHEDVSFFLDKEMFAREQRKFFRDMPLVACLSNQLEPGAFRTFDLPGVPMIVVRAKDGKVRAFLNICRHRGARIVREDCGNASRFTCRFHGWTYDNAGKAVGIPEESQFCSEIDAEKNLIPCPAEERHGLVFVQATPNGRMDLDAHLGEFAKELAIIELDKAIPVFVEDLPFRANWKYAIDTFFETYHLNSLHKDTFRGLFSPHCVFETFGRHHRYTFAPKIVHDWVDMPESEWNLHLVPLQYFLFPNTIIAVGSTTPSGSTVGMHNLFPHAVDSFTDRFSFCAMHGVRSEEHRAEIRDSFEKSKVAVCREDYSVTSEAQAALAVLPKGTTFPIGRLEIGVDNFHRNVRELVDA